MPFKVFTNGVPLPASDLNDYLMEQSIATFADSAARDAAITSPIEGQLAYTADNDTYWSYTGTTWGSFGGGQTLISTTTLTGSSIVLSSIPQGYYDLKLVVRNFRPSADADLLMRINGLSTAIYMTGGGTTAAGSGTTSWTVAASQDSSITPTANFALQIISLFDYTNSTTNKLGEFTSIVNDATTNAISRRLDNTLSVQNTSAITSITLLPSTGTFTSGTALLYGVR